MGRRAPTRLCETCHRPVDPRFGIRIRDSWYHEGHEPRWPLAHSPASYVAATSFPTTKAALVAEAAAHGAPQPVIDGVQRLAQEQFGSLNDLLRALSDS